MAEICGIRRVTIRLQGKLYYVGVASDLRWRLNAHLRDRLALHWDGFSVCLTVGDKHLRELESLLLTSVVVRPKPSGNVQTGKFTSSRNLVFQLRREIKAHQREELNSLVGLNSKPVARLATTRDGVPLAKYVTAPFGIRARFKGKTHCARVRRDGTIRFRGCIYKSPSGAGRAICKRACDGWWFWKYERAPGDWVRLRALRG